MVPAARALGIMEEEVTQKVVSLCVRTGCMTEKELARAFKLFLDAQQKKKNQYARGKQTLKKLIGQNTETTNIEITDGNIKAFERTARKYGIDYALKKDRSCQPPKYYVFFKARDMEAMTMAFREFVTKNEKKREQQHGRKSVRDILKRFTLLTRNQNREREREKSRDRGQSL